ncbi:MAG: Ig-like domain-containing protein, partial [Planctomycetota bacterium]
MTQTSFRRPQASATSTTRVEASIPRRGAVPGAVGLAALLLAAACNSTDSPEPIVDGVGGYVTNSSGGNYFVDENIGGVANEFRIAQQFYGRLVTIVSQAPDPAPGVRGERREIHRDFVVDPRAESAWDPDSYILETNPVTGAQTLVVLADFTDLTGASLLPGDTDASGRAKFLRLLRGADGGRIVTDSGFTGTGTFTMVPRNAAIVFVFDDLIDSETVTSAAVRFLEGTDGTTPFARAPRFFVDRNHGAAADLDGLPGSEFYSTRLIVDAAVSELESEGFTPFTPVNNRGLPPSVDGGRANIQIRFGTQLAPGQSLPPLQNPSGGRLASTGNGSVDGSSSGFDVVRAFRSGGDRNVLSDPFNGYLPDESEPVVVSSLTGLITQAPVLIAGDSDLSYRIPEIRFDSILCAPDPEPGDIIAQPPFFARVTAPASTNDVTGIATDVEVELVVVPTDSFTGPEQYTVSGLGSLQYRTPLVLENADRPECFLSVTPSPTGGAGAPSTGIATDARVALRFNEPIDPGPLEPYESVMLLRRPRPQIPTDYVPGTVDVDSSLTLVTFRPTQPLAHVFGNTETYYLWLPGGLEAPVDLAGRSVALLPRVQPTPSDIPEGVPLTIEANEPSSLTGGHVFRFSSRDEQFPFADPANATRILQIPQEEWDGTALRDTVTGRLRGRSVVRFQQPISQTTDNPTVAAMATGPGTPLPLNPSGAITQWVWRYVDMGLTIYSENEITNRVESDDVDIDVEGLYLSPQNANPVFENYGEFEIAMSHSNSTPDEAVDPFNNLLDGGSGLTTNYTNNLLSPAETPFQVIHDRSRGLTTQPGNTTQASDGTLLMSLGLNDDLPAEQFTTFTWRDTTIRTRGGTNAGGVPEARLAAVTANINPLAPADTTGDGE